MLKTIAKLRQLKNISVFASLLPLVITAAFFMHSLQFTGPAYLADEVSYLTKAATLAGHKVDAGSSYHAGYSLLIVPAFLLFENPILAWKAVLFINALLWGSSFYLLQRMLRMMLPKLDRTKLLIVTAASAIYPSWIVMSGYSFSTPGSVYMLMLSLYLLLKADNKNLSNYVFFGISAGFLYWIHPTALAFVLSAALVLFVKAVAEKRYKPFVITLGPMLSMLAIYTVLFHPWLNSYMTPPGATVWEHYDVVARTAKDNPDLVSANLFMTTAVMVAGQLSYLLIGSFGTVGIAAFLLWDKVKNLHRKSLLKDIQTLLTDKQTMIVVLLFLTIMGVVIAGSLNFILANDATQGGRVRADHWLYGRYSEVFILPLLALGLIGVWRIGRMIAMVLFVLGSGVLLANFADENNTVLESVNMVNVVSFWPLQFREHTDFLFWFMVGAAGLLITGLVVRLLGKKALLLTVPLLILSVGTHNNWHRSILGGNSVQSPFTNIIHKTYEKQSCIGFEYSEALLIIALENERTRLLTYENIGYGIRRMSLKEWLKNCEGPYITPLVYKEPELEGAKYVAREDLSGLYMIAKPEHVSKFNRIDDSRFKQNIYLNPNDSDCVARGCFINYATEIRDKTRVGKLEHDKLITTNTPGVFIFGPPTELAPGSYRLTFDMDILSEKPFAHVMVTGEQGNEVFLDVPLVKDQPYRFTLDENVDNFEVLIIVEESADLRFKSYTIELDK